VREHLLDEVPGPTALTLQPALHVGDRHQHGIDLPGRDKLPQTLNTQLAAISHGHSPILLVYDQSIDASRRAVVNVVARRSV
jgi:hypothetical protein